jgi:hypothetical protein
MIRMRNLPAMVLAMTLVTAGAAWAGQTEKPLDNAEVIKLTKADMGDVVIIAKIKSATSVQFATGTDDLIKLKAAGVSKDVMAALLDRTNAPAGGATAASSASASVTLQAKEGAVSLREIEGDVKTIVAPFVGMRRFIVFPEFSAKTRTKDLKPTVTIATDKDPRKVYWMVKLDPSNKDKERSLDIESPGYWGGVMTSAPDGDTLIKVDVVEEKPGLWRLTPTKQLKPGEYGIYIGKGEKAANLFDFGIDK